RAALAARSTSALSPSATWQMTSPVAGLVVWKNLPETLSSHLPPMNSGCCGLTLGGLTVRLLGAVAVVMETSSLRARNRQGPIHHGPRLCCSLSPGTGGRQGVAFACGTL